MFDSLASKFTGIFARLSGKRKLTEKNIDEACGEVRRALIDADVNIRIVREFVGRIKEQAIGIEIIPGVQPDQQFIKIVHDEVESLLGPTDSGIYFNPTGPTVILMSGLQGSGKTTTCAKLAKFLQSRGRHPLLVAADVQRPAAIEQLQVLGGQIKVPVYAEPGGHPPTICENAVHEAKKTGRDTVILDTAGRLHIDEELMAELEDVARRTKPQEIFLVCDAMTGQDAVNSAKEFNERLEISGVILTKLDGDARGGAALSIKQVTGKTIKFIGDSEKLDGLQPFHPDRMTQRILGMGDIATLVEKAQEALDQEQAQASAEKLLSGKFTLADMLDQLDQVAKLGSFKSVVKLIPGAGAMLDQADFDDGELERIKAMIQSMTPEERERPEIVDPSRRKRIARGSGADTRDVNGLLKQHRDMKKMMVGKGRFAGMFQNMMAGAGDLMQRIPGMGGNGGQLGPAGKKKRLSQKEKKRRRKKGRR